MKESENRVKYLELAIGILRSPPSEDTENLRVWAIDVMDKYSEVSINQKMKQELAKKRIIQIPGGSRSFSITAGESPLKIESIDEEGSQIIIKLEGPGSKQKTPK